MKITFHTSGPSTRIRMREPWDMHIHMRDGEMLKLVGPMSMKRFAGGIIMPNLNPPLTTVESVLNYLADICRVRDAERENFRPLMTMYLTDTLDPNEVRMGVEHKVVFGVKYYPRGLTTNSDSGVEDPKSLWTKDTRPYQVLRVLAEQGGVLLLHAADGVDAKGHELDPYDQELHFIISTLLRIIEAHPDLKISVEHLSTAWGVDFVRQHGGEKLGCSLTAHHLLLDRRDVFRGGFHPHMHWWPIIQPKEHKEELRKLASEDHPFVWLGSDSAPHVRDKKIDYNKSDCCIGGVLMAHAGIELYVEAFEDMGALDDRFERFASINGPRFYGVEPSAEEIVLVRKEWKVEQPFFADEVPRGGSPRELVERVIPFRLGETIRWKLLAA